MLKVQDLYKNAVSSSDASALFDYELSGYITDLVQEIADSSTDTYWSDLSRWLDETRGSEGYMEQVIEDGLIQAGLGYNFFTHLKIAQSLYFEDQITGALDDCDTVTAAAMRYLAAKEIEEITEEQLEEIESLYLSSFDTFAEFNAAVLEIVTPEEEEEENEEGLTA